MHHFNLSVVDPSWLSCLERGLNAVDQTYLNILSQSGDWLPGPDKIFNAFSLPIDQVKFVLFGESPYPRAESANGYAFWDAAVKNLWTETGMSTRVNRATSLRNFIKMLMVAEGCLLSEATTQENIASLNKSAFVQTNSELFHNLLNHGFLLLNATPVLHAKNPQKDARAWLGFTKVVLDCLLEKNPQVTFILFGRIAATIDKLIPLSAKNRLYAEHPYNHSFITNHEVLQFFKPLTLLHR